jgi:hypothetical protein
MDSSCTDDDCSFAARMRSVRFAALSWTVPRRWRPPTLRTEQSSNSQSRRAEVALAAITGQKSCRTLYTLVKHRTHLHVSLFTLVKHRAHLHVSLFTGTVERMVLLATSHLLVPVPDHARRCGDPNCRHGKRLHRDHDRKRHDDKDPSANEEQRAQSAGIRFALDTATEPWIGETGATQ